MTEGSFDFQPFQRFLISRKSSKPLKTVRGKIFVALITLLKPGENEREGKPFMFLRYNGELRCRRKNLPSHMIVDANLQLVFTGHQAGAVEQAG